MSNAEKATEIRQLLTEFSLRDQIEILANVLMFLGASSMRPAPKHITKENIAKIVMDDRKSNGETIANALATQGLTMMLWLTDK